MAQSRTKRIIFLVSPKINLSAPQTIYRFSSST